MYCFCNSIFPNHFQVVDSIWEINTKLWSFSLILRSDKKCFFLFYKQKPFLLQQNMSPDCNYCFQNCIWLKIGYIQSKIFARYQKIKRILVREYQHNSNDQGHAIKIKSKVNQGEIKFNLYRKIVRKYTIN